MVRACFEECAELDGVNGLVGVHRTQAELRQTQQRAHRHCSDKEAREPSSFHGFAVHFHFSVVIQLVRGIAAAEQPNIPALYAPRIDEFTLGSLDVAHVLPYPPSGCVVMCRC